MGGMGVTGGANSPMINVISVISVGGGGVYGFPFHPRWFPFLATVATSFCFLSFFLSSFPPFLLSSFLFFLPSSFLTSPFGIRCRVPTRSDSRRLWIEILISLHHALRPQRPPAVVLCSDTSYLSERLWSVLGWYYITLRSFLTSCIIRRLYFPHSCP